MKTRTEIIAAIAAIMASDNGTKQWVAVLADPSA